MNTYQAIETRYVGPTNHRPSRIIATTPSEHKLTVSFDYSLGIEGNHYAAAKALCDKLGWDTIKAGGSTNQGFAWVTSILDGAA
jgi:hypothetical protein